MQKNLHHMHPCTHAHTHPSATYSNAPIHSDRTSRTPGASIAMTLHTHIIVSALCHTHIHTLAGLFQPPYMPAYLMTSRPFQLSCMPTCAHTRTHTHTHTHAHTHKWTIVMCARKAGMMLFNAGYLCVHVGVHVCVRVCVWAWSAHLTLVEQSLILLSSATLLYTHMHTNTNTCTLVCTGLQLPHQLVILIIIKWL